MNLENSSTIGSDKLWFTIAPGGVTMEQGAMKREGWSRKFESIEVDGHDVRAGAKFFGEDTGTGNVRVFVDLQDMSARVQFNPSKVLTSHELCTDILKSYEHVENRLSIAGLHLDRDAGKVTRKDIACDAILAEVPENSMPHLSNFLKFRRCKRKVDDVHGITMGNASVQLQFYNKHEQLNMLGISHNLHPHTGRNELRILSNARGLLDKYTPTLNDALKLSHSDLVDIYRSEVTARVHIASTSEIQQMKVESLRDAMSFYSINYGRNWLSRYLINEGMNHLIAEVGRDELTKLLTSIDAKKTAKNEGAKIKRSIAQSMELERARRFMSNRTPMSYVDEYLRTFALTA
jgi:hypothetical protein